MNIKISPLDKLFSQYIRTRDGWQCQRCFKKYVPPTSGLHNSHFWGRAKKSVRFDPENCCALCCGCHQHLGANPLEHTEWYKKRLGEKRFNALMIKANKPSTPDYEMIRIWVKAKLNELS